MKQLDVVRSHNMFALLVVVLLVSSTVSGMLTATMIDDGIDAETEFRYDVNTEGLADASDDGTVFSIPFESLSEFEQTQLEKGIGNGGIDGSDVTVVTQEQKQTVIDGVDVVSIDGVRLLVTVEESTTKPLPLLFGFVFVSYLITLVLSLFTASWYRRLERVRRRDIQHTSEFV